MTSLGPVIEFEPRFVPKELLSDLAALWQISRVPHGLDRYKRMLWASTEFHKEHPEISVTAAYKDLEGMLSHGGV